jgi:hypothetical protein
VNYLLGKSVPFSNIFSVLDKVLARILDLGRISNDQGVHMSITLNSKITVLVMLANNNACGCSMKILSYFSNSWGYLKPF